MIANYHTHTTRCKHAIGTEREYIETAIEAGMKELGFSDHVPYRFPDFVSGIRMAMEEVPDYVQTLVALREEYKKDIRIYIGFEAEYFPELFGDLIEELSAYAYDYMILGQHFLLPEPNGVYIGSPIYGEELLARYVELSLEGLATGKFAYFAHPDLPNFKGDRKLYKKHMRRLCEGAKRMNIPLEINFTGYMDRRNYPCKDFWEIAGKVGNCAVLGCDAHRPEVLSMKELEYFCTNLATDCGLRIIERLNLENGQ